MLTYEEYQLQSKSFCDALELIKQELAQKRNEMATLAKTTADQLEPRIPELQAQINTLTSEVSRLDTLVLDKNKQSEYDENYWKNYYLNLQENLESNHKNRTEELEARHLAQDNRDSIYQDQIIDLQLREKSLKDGLELLSISNNALDAIRINFEKERSIHEDKARKIMLDLNSHINEINEEKLKQKSISDNIDKQSLELTEKTKKADVIIKNINEAQAILDKANKVSNNNELERLNLISEQEKLNELSIKNRAEIQRILNDQDALDVRDRALKQRESNIKAVEASLNKG